MSACACACAFLLLQIRARHGYNMIGKHILIYKSYQDCGHNCGGYGGDVGGDIDNMMALVVNVSVEL